MHCKFPTKMCIKFALYLLNKSANLALKLFSIGLNEVLGASTNKKYLQSRLYDLALKHEINFILIVRYELDYQ